METKTKLSRSEVARLGGLARAKVISMKELGRKGGIASGRSRQGRLRGKYNQESDAVEN